MIKLLRNYTPTQKELFAMGFGDDPIEAYFGDAQELYDIYGNDKAVLDHIRDVVLKELRKEEGYRQNRLHMSKVAFLDDADDNQYTNKIKSIIDRYGDTPEPIPDWVMKMPEAEAKQYIEHVDKSGFYDRWGKNEDGTDWSEEQWERAEQHKRLIDILKQRFI